MKKLNKKNPFTFTTNSLYKAARKQQGTGSRKRYFIDLEEVDLETFVSERNDNFLPAESFKICWASVKGDIFNVIPRLQNKTHFAKNGSKKVLDKDKLFSKTALRRYQAKRVIAPVSDYALLALGQEVVVESFEDGSKIVLVDLVEEQVFAKACDREDGNQELCNPTGRMVVEANGDWWYEYEDSLGGLHYGR